MFCVSCLCIWWRHDIWITEKLKFDYLRNEKSFWSEIKNFSLLRKWKLNNGRTINKLPVAGDPITILHAMLTWTLLQVVQSWYSYSFDIYNLYTEVLLIYTQIYRQLIILLEITCTIVLYKKEERYIINLHSSFLFY